MANGFELDATSARVGKLVYASNPKLPGIITALLGGRLVRVAWLSGRISEQYLGGLYDLELRIDTYAAIWQTISWPFNDCWPDHIPRIEQDGKIDLRLRRRYVVGSSFPQQRSVSRPADAPPLRVRRATVDANHR